MPRSDWSVSTVLDEERAGDVAMSGARYFSRSLERGLVVLGCFTAERPVLGVHEVADALGMSRPTTHRYMVTLARLGYLMRASGRRYALSLRVVDLGMSALSGMSLGVQVRGCLEKLSLHTGFTVAVGVFDRPGVLVVERVRGARGARRGLRAVDPYSRAGEDARGGYRLPAHGTAMGKLLLASLPDRLLRGLLAQLTLSRCAPRTIIGKRALRAELMEIRQRALAVSDEEL